MKKSFLFVFLFIIIFLCIIYFKNSTSFFVKKEDSTKNIDSFQTININDYYNEYVITNKDSDIYIYDNNSFYKIGVISSGVELSLGGIIDNYFIINSLDDTYYIKYEDVNKIDTLSSYDDRYKKYILFNQDIITDNNTSFYNENNELVLTFNKSYKLPILIKKEDRYGVLFNEKLYYVLKKDVRVIDSNNSSDTNTKGISVLNYHFFYDDTIEKERISCNQSICEPLSKFKEQLKYIKDNNFFTPTLEELEMYIDGDIQLPKSVIITIDDGWRANQGIDLLEEYKLNGVLFLITAWYNPNNYKNNYIEIASHGDNLHNNGVCYGGQGGAIKCMSHDKLLEDLKKSRYKLNNTKYFCYPFYEYNDYSIKVLKEAGYSMAFGGEYENGYKYVKPGIDKFRLPRWVIVNYTEMNTFKQYLNLG